MNMMRKKFFDIKKFKMYKKSINKIKYKPQDGRVHRIETQTVNKHDVQTH